MKPNTLLIALIVLISFSVNARKELVQHWTSYSQSFDATPYQNQKFRVSVAIRKESTDEKSWASLWVRVDNKKDDNGFFKNDAGGKDVTDKWKVFQIEGVVDNDGDIFNFGAFCTNNGNFYFDDYKVEFLNKENEWETRIISNPGFEDDDKGDYINSWSEGIHNEGIAKVKGFIITYTEDSPFKGKRAVLIKGENITE